ncbi:MAG: DUF5615 family PIN-like protein [Promethearchaeota archaeon]
MLDNFLFIFDENIPLSVISYFSKKENFSIFSVRQNIPGSSDISIVDISRERKGIIITFDKDFGYLAYSQKRSPFGVILLRFSPKSPKYIREMLVVLFEHIKRLDVSLRNNFIVFDGKKLRVRKIE